MKFISTILFTACFLLQASTMKAQWETQPEFPGGPEAMFSFIDSVRRYPQEAVAKKIEGRVITNFVVEKDGSISDITIARGVDSLLDNEAKRIFEAMPKWKPGTQNGDIVRVRFTLPILFSLDENGEPLSYKEAMDKASSEWKRKIRP